MTTALAGTTHKPRNCPPTSPVQWVLNITLIFQTRESVQNSAQSHTIITEQKIFTSFKINEFSPVTLPTNSGTTELNWNILLAKELAMASRARIYLKKKKRQTDKVWQEDSKQRLWGQCVDWKWPVQTTNDCSIVDGKQMTQRSVWS